MSGAENNHLADGRNNFPVRAYDQQCRYLLLKESLLPADAGSFRLGTSMWVQQRGREGAKF